MKELRHHLKPIKRYKFLNINILGPLLRKKCFIELPLEEDFLPLRYSSATTFFL